MSILKVARMGHPVLRRRARPLDRAEIAGAPIQKLIDDLIDTMREYHGIGLAAPQVHESLRLFVAGIEAGRSPAADGEDDLAVKVVTIVNPEITPIGRAVVEEWEGCLSIPEIRGLVPRAREIRVRGFDRHGERFEIEARDFSARVIQHETDHLDGILFVDRMKSLDSLTYLDEYGRFWVKD